MAGAGRRTFTPGEVLTASNVMNYLQDQAVMNFAGTAARGSAIGTAVSEGMVSYLADTNDVQAYDGSAWLSVKNPIGSIAQVVTATATAEVTTTSTSFITTGLSATITPQSASNKILILVHSTARTNTSGVSAYHTIFRGTVAGTNLGNTSFGRHYFGSNIANIVMFDIHTVDSPATTSATTYTLGFRGDNAAQTVYTNADSQTAKMTLLEIVA